MEIGTDVERKLTYLPKDWYIQDFDISPSGKRVVYIPYTRAFKNALIRVVDLPSGRLDVITGLNDPGIEYRVRWLVLKLDTVEFELFPDYSVVYQSPNRRFRLAYDISTHQYILLDLGIDEQRSVSENVRLGKFIDWSPNSQYMLFYSKVISDSQPNQLILVDPITQREINTLYGQAIVSAKWAPDGERIAYSNCNSMLENCDIWIVSEDRKDSHVIQSDNSLRAIMLDWSPDGSRLIFQKTIGDLEFWSIRIDGTDLRPVVSNVYDCRVVDIP